MVIDVGRIKHLGDLMHKSIASNGTSVTSNWRLSADGLSNVVWSPESAGGGVSYGSNANDVGNPSAPGASSLVSRADHVHRGVTSISHASNTAYGAITLLPGANVGITSVAGAFTISASATGGSGGSGRVSPERVLVDPTGLSWSWVNQGSATITSNGASLALLGPAGAGDSWRQRVKSVPSKPYSIIIHQRIGLMSVNNAGCAVGWRDSASSKLALARHIFDSAGGNWNIDSAKYTNSTTFSAVYTNNSNNVDHWQWIKLTDDTTNRRIYLSRDGFNWILFHSVATNDFLTPDQVLFAVSPRNATYDGGLTVDSWEEA